MSEVRKDPATGTQIWIGIALLMIQLAATLFVATRESAGVRAEASMHGYAAAMSAYQATLIDANARIRVLETRTRWLEKALWQDKFPDVDPEVLEQLKEILSEKRDETRR